MNGQLTSGNVTFSPFLSFFFGPPAPPPPPLLLSFHLLKVSSNMRLQDPLITQVEKKHDKEKSVTLVLRLRLLPETQRGEHQTPQT